MVKPALSLPEAERLVIELEQAEARGDAAAATGRMDELEEAIGFLMGLNLRLAGNNNANAAVASLQLRARTLRERTKRLKG
ncbi:MAG: hypothetical protein NT031_03395 [Planctomycetota bacterium]|nr:hypothetical protein [Planctomycetota bacterium]